MESDWSLARAFMEGHPYEAALTLEKFVPAQSGELLLTLPEDVAVQVMTQMSSSTSAACLSAFPNDVAGRVIESMSLEIAARMLRCLTAEERERSLTKVSERRSLSLQRLLTYPPGTAGSLMDPQVLALPGGLSVHDALERVQRSPHHSFYYVYVIDSEQRLAGVINLRELMLAEPHEVLANAMHKPVESLSASASLTTILLHPAWREFHALPVTDDSDRFLGAIRSKTLARLEQERGRRPIADESMTALLSLGELCWIGFAGMLAGLAATVFPQTWESNKSEETRYDRID